jgi:glycosyltransferase involved in cell wall biosynthesis
MAPRVSIGLPVRNGEKYIGRAIDSLIAQDYQDFEVVICDNASDDATPDIVRGYAARDPRIKFHENGRDIGQIANMNRVFELASGEYFRWTGMDDWFEPNYISKSVEYLDLEPCVIAVSTYIKYSDDGGNEFYTEYTGERMESPEPHRRFSRMLWFFQVDYRYYDPHYAMYRRSALQQTRLLQVAFGPDNILSAELSLVGPFGHIPECLSYRRRVPAAYDDKEVLHALYHPDQPHALRPSASRLCSNFNVLVSTAPLTGFQKAVCRGAIARFFLKAELRALNDTVRGVARRVPGYRRAKAVLGR